MGAYVEVGEDPRGHALVSGHQPEQKMLRTEIGVVEARGPASPLSEPLEHPSLTSSASL